MINKQDLIKDLSDGGVNDEEILSIINKYPEMLSDEDADKLDVELQEYVVDNQILAKAYTELADDFDNQAEMITDTYDKAVKRVAQTAYDDLSWASKIIKEE